MPDNNNNNNDEAMRIDPHRAKQLLENLTNVQARIHSANPTGKNIRLVAISKLKPATDILALHNQHPPTSTQHQHLHFGENYQQELLAKAALLPRSVRWHFVGALQTNKCKPLAQSVPNLWCVESVDSSKKAALLDKGRAALVEAESAEEQGAARGQGEGETEREREKLRVFVQVNTSGEAAKAGVEPGAAVGALCRFVRDECAHLRLQGLMTIGAIARSRAAGTATGEGEEVENEDFRVLREVRDEVAAELGVERGELELSMGMSADFEAAVRAGSDEVRVGTTIFGERPARKDAKVMESVEDGDG